MPTYKVTLQETDDRKRTFDLGKHKAKTASEAEKKAQTKFKGMLNRLVTGRFVLAAQELSRD